jgi:hypothetical protein
MIMGVNPLSSEMIGNFKDENIIRDHKWLYVLKPLMMNLRA